MSDCDSGTVTSVLKKPVVAVVLVSPSSVVTEVCDGFSFNSDWEFVEDAVLFLTKSVKERWVMQGRL